MADIVKVSAEELEARLHRAQATMAEKRAVEKERALRTEMVRPLVKKLDLSSFRVQKG